MRGKKTEEVKINMRTVRIGIYHWNSGVFGGSWTWSAPSRYVYHFNAESVLSSNIRYIWRRCSHFSYWCRRSLCSRIQIETKCNGMNHKCMHSALSRIQWHVAWPHLDYEHIEYMMFRKGTNPLWLQWKIWDVDHDDPDPVIITIT